MKKLLQNLSALIMLMVWSTFVFGQMPLTITVEYADGTAGIPTGWDEIILSVDVANSCTPDDKQSCVGLAQLGFHSAAYTADNELGDGWGDMGIDFNGESGEDGVTPTLTDEDGDGIYSIKFTPGLYYKVPEGTLINGLSCVFNNGTSWDNECKDNAADGSCTDFIIPLTVPNLDPSFGFKVNMNKMIEDGNFDAIADAVYGVVSGGDLTDALEVELIDFDGTTTDGIFEGVIESGLTEGTIYDVQFRINSDELETIEARKVEAIKGKKTIEAWWNDETGTVLADIKIQVNMQYQIAGQVSSTAAFDPATDYVDVAGSFNDWDGKDHHLTKVDGEEFIYETVIEDVGAGDIAEFKFRLNGDWNTSEFPGGDPNRKYTVRDGENLIKYYYDNYLPGSVPVTFSVNMNYVTDNGVFDPEVDFVDIAGSLNGWGGGNGNSDQLWDDDNDLIYVGKVLSTVGDIEWKVRINSSWDNDKHEFPAGGPARKLTVADTTGGVINASDIVWFNDWDPNVASAPMAKDVKIEGTATAAGDELTASYTYEDVNGDAEGTSIFAWYLVTDTDTTMIDGATALTYTIAEGDLGKYIEFSVTPVASVSTGEGDEALIGEKVMVRGNSGNMVNINDASVNNIISLFPNPMNDILYVKNSKNIQSIVISNMIGQQVANIYTSNESNIEINTSNLENGIYIVTIVDENSTISSHKVIKQ